MCEICDIKVIATTTKPQELQLLQTASFPPAITQILEETYDEPEQVTHGELVINELTYEYFSSSVTSLMVGFGDLSGGFVT